MDFTINGLSRRCKEASGFLRVEPFPVRKTNYEERKEREANEFSLRLHLHSIAWQIVPAQVLASGFFV
jgi:hypothetical protein